MQVAVLDPITHQQVFTCEGPSMSGGCRREPASDVLPCEGYVLQTRSGQQRLDGYRFEVTESGPGCPLRALALFQQLRG